MRRVALLIVLAAGACAEEQGRYHPDTVLALAGTRGDAKGTLHTGVWNTTLTEIECSCSASPIVAGLGILDPCAILRPLGGSSLPLVQTVEADGYLRMAIGNETDFGGIIQALELLGSIDADGEVRVGEVRRDTAVIGSVRSLARLDGTIVDELVPGGPREASLEGELVTRIHGESAQETYDCAGIHEVAATMSLPNAPFD